MGLEGEGSGGRGGGKRGERGREVGIGYPPVHPLSTHRQTEACNIIMLTALYFPSSHLVETKHKKRSQDKQYTNT